MTVSQHYRMDGIKYNLIQPILQDVPMALPMLKRSVYKYMPIYEYDESSFPTGNLFKSKSQRKIFYLHISYAESTLTKKNRNNIGYFFQSYGSQRKLKKAINHPQLLKLKEMITVQILARLNALSLIPRKYFPFPVIYSSINFQ